MDNFSQFYEQFLTESFNVTSVDRLNLTLLSGLKSEHPEHKESDFFHVQNLGGEDYYIALPGGSLGVRTNNGDIFHHNKYAGTYEKQFTLIELSDFIEQLGANIELPADNNNLQELQGYDDRLKIEQPEEEPEEEPQPEYDYDPDETEQISEPKSEEEVQRQNDLNNRLSPELRQMADEDEIEASTHSDVRDFLEDTFDSPADVRQPIILYGDPGIGKTVSLRQSSKVFAEKSNNRTPVTFDLATAVLGGLDKDSGVKWDAVINNPRKYYVLLEIRITSMNISDLVGATKLTKLETDYTELQKADVVEPWNNENIKKQAEEIVQVVFPGGMYGWRGLLMNEHASGMLFFDEVNLVESPFWLAQIMPFLDENSRNIGNNQNWIVVGAANIGPEYAGQAQEWSPAQMSRQHDIYMVVEPQDWIDWAETGQGDAKGISPHMIDFIRNGMEEDTRLNKEHGGEGALEKKNVSSVQKRDKYEPSADGALNRLMHPTGGGRKPLDPRGIRRIGIFLQTLLESWKDKVQTTNADETERKKLFKKLVRVPFDRKITFKKWREDFWGWWGKRGMSDENVISRFETDPHGKGEAVQTHIIDKITGISNDSKVDTEKSGLKGEGDNEHWGIVEGEAETYGSTKTLNDVQKAFITTTGHYGGGFDTSIEDEPNNDDIRFIFKSLTLGQNEDANIIMSQTFQQVTIEEVEKQISTKERDRYGIGSGWKIVGPEHPGGTMVPLYSPESGLEEGDTTVKIPEVKIEDVKLYDSHMLYYIVDLIAQNHIKGTKKFEDMEAKFLKWFAKWVSTDDNLGKTTWTKMTPEKFLQAVKFAKGVKWVQEPKWRTKFDDNSIEKIQNAGQWPADQSDVGIYTRFFPGGRGLDGIYPSTSTRAPDQTHTYQIPIPAIYDSENGKVNSGEWETKMISHWEEVRAIIDKEISELGDYQLPVYPGEKGKTEKPGLDTLANTDLGFGEGIKIDYTTSSSELINMMNLPLNDLSFNDLLLIDTHYNRK